MSIYVVLGPPVAGKSEYVKAHAKDGNVIIDYDLIAHAMGSRVAHDSTGSVRIVALESRKTAIERILRGLEDDAWIIHTNPQPEVMRAYVEAGVTFTMLNPGKNEVLRRAKASGRPASTIAAIEAWYANPPVIPDPKKAMNNRTLREGRVMDLQQAFDAGFEQVKSYIDAELGFIKSQLPLPAVPGPQGPSGEKGEPGRDATELMVPPYLAVQVAGVVRLLHEASPIEAVAKAVPPPPRVVRIDRDEQGSFVPVYDEKAQP